MAFEHWEVLVGDWRIGREFATRLLFPPPLLGRAFLPVAVYPRCFQGPLDRPAMVSAAVI